MQRATMELSLQLLETATKPESLITPFSWSQDDHWKQAFMRLDDKNPDDLLRLGEESRAKRDHNRALGLVR